MSASLDGSPLPAATIGMLGLDAGAIDGVHRLDGCRIRLIDPSAGAVHVSARVGDFVGVLGDFDEPAEVADRLGLHRSTPVADLARAALDRHGADTATWIDGNWTIVRWQASRSRLTLVGSSLARDPVYHAADGRRWAVSSDLRSLSRVLGVEGAVDPRGLAMAVGTARVRRVRAEETIVPGVHRLRPGQHLAIDAGGVRRAMAAAQPLPEWKGDFTEACRQVEALLARVVRGHLDRHGDIAVMTSGGLDSTLLACVAAEQARSGQRVTLMTSVAPPGSGLPDEAGFARRVAQATGLPLVPVRPADDADVLRPPRPLLDHWQEPVAGVYHALYDAFYRQAAELGADAVLDGANGEATVTGTPAMPAGRLPERWLRLAAGRRGAFADQPLPSRWPVDGFHARLLPALVDGFDDLRQAFEAPVPDHLPTRLDQRWGVRQAIGKQAFRTSDTGVGAVRHLDPFCDRRLVRLMAGMPASFFRRGARTRLIARTLLAERVPDDIRLRSRGLPFSPDFYRRIARDAAGANDRVPALRRGGIGAYLDLDWLASAGRRIAGAGTLQSPYEREQYLVTANTAEFLLHWLGAAGNG